METQLQRTKRVKYTESEGFKMSRSFAKKIGGLVKKFASVSDDGIIYLPRKVKIDVIDCHSGRPKLRNITVDKLTADMNIIGGHGEMFLPELIRVFDWEVILRMLENGR